MKHIILIIIILLVIVIRYKIEKFISKNNLINKIYFINLDKSLDRLIFMKKQLHNLDIHYERFNAVDGSKLNINNLLQQKILTTNKMMRGAVGCSLSHINLWKRIHKFNDEWFLILEDDCILDPNFNNKFYIYKKQIPVNFDILYLGGSNIYGKRISENILKPISSYLSSTRNTGMYGMIIKKKIIPLLLKYNLPITDNIDQVIKNKLFDKINAYYIVPPLITHNNHFKSMRRVNSNKNPFTIWSKKIQPQITIID